jgi:excisionase family DNA binding protein
MTNVIQRPEATATGTLPSVQEGYITKEEVARRLTKTVRTVENWQRRGYLPFVKVGQSVLFRWSDVVTHLDQNFTVGRSTAGK